MGAGWIAQGPDAPLPANAQVDDPWKPVGPDTDSVPALVRPHQNPNAHPIDNTRGLMTRTRDLLFGHEPAGPEDTDRVTQPGILPSVWRDLTPTSQPEAGSPAAMKRAGEIAQSGDQSPAAKQEIERLARPEQQGPKLGTMATALGHLYGADVSAAELAEAVLPSIVFFEDTFGAKIENIYIGGIAPLQEVGPLLHQHTGTHVRELSPELSPEQNLSGENIRASAMAAIVGALLG